MDNALYGAGALILLAVLGIIGIRIMIDSRHVNFEITFPVEESTNEEWANVSGTSPYTDWDVRVFTYLPGTGCFLQPGSDLTRLTKRWGYLKVHLATPVKLRYIYAITSSTADMAKIGSVFGADRVIPDPDALKTILQGTSVRYHLSPGKLLVRPDSVSEQA